MRKRSLSAHLNAQPIRGNFKPSMAAQDVERTSWGVLKHLFDYSSVASFSAGTGTERQFFAFNTPDLCRHSTYFQAKVHGEHPDGGTQHFDFDDVDPSTIACMLCWYRGWHCTFCEHDRGHIEAASRLAVDFGIPGFSKYLALKMETLDVTGSRVVLQPKSSSSIRRLIQRMTKRRRWLK